MTKWESKTIGDVLTLEYGKPLPAERRSPSGRFPAYGANGVRAMTDEVYVDSPSIIVGRKGSAGAVTFADGPFWPLDVTYFVDYDEQQYDLRFLYYLLLSLDLPSLAKGVKPGLNRNDVYALEALLPDLDKQKQVASTLDEAFEVIDLAAENARNGLAKLEEMGSSLLSWAFSGRLGSLD